MKKNTQHQINGCGSLLQEGIEHEIKNDWEKYGRNSAVQEFHLISNVCMCL